MIHLGAHGSVEVLSFEFAQAVAWRLEVIGQSLADHNGLWIVEWVATRPEFRGRALIHRLLPASAADALAGLGQGLRSIGVGSPAGPRPAKVET